MPKWVPISVPTPGKTFTRSDPSMCRYHSPRPRIIPAGTRPSRTATPDRVPANVRSVASGFDQFVVVGVRTNPYPEEF
jgi:hypothetical protein